MNAYTSFLIKYRYLVLFLSVAAVLVMSAGMGKIQFTNDIKAFFSHQNPKLVAWETLEDEYGKQEDVLFYFKSAEGQTVFDPAFLEVLYNLSEEAWEWNYVKRVSSITNYQHTYAEDDDMITEFLVEDPTKLDSARIQKIRDVTLNEPSLKNLLVSQDGRSTILSVLCEFPQDSVNAAKLNIVHFARTKLDSIRKVLPDMEVHLGGMANSNVTLSELVGKDLETLVLGSYIVILLGLFFFLRSALGVVATLFVITLSIAAGMGTFGWIGIELTPVAGWVPSVVMTVAVADCVHILVSYFQVYSRRSRELSMVEAKREAIRESMRLNLNPVIVTSITTIIGMLCLNFSDSPPYRILGNIVAVGVGVAMFLSLTAFPALLMVLPAPKRDTVFKESTWLVRYAKWIIAKRKKATILSIFFVLVCGILASQNRLTERWFEYFGTEVPHRVTQDLIDQEMSGIDYLVFSLESGKESGIKEPAYMKAVEHFTLWLREQPEVGHVTSVTDLIKRLNKNMHGDDPAFYRVPYNKNLISQYLFLYELSVPKGYDLNNVINFKRSATKVTVTLKSMDSETLLKFEDRVNLWMGGNGKEFTKAEPAGIDIIFAYINHSNARSMVMGSAVALIIISIVLVFILKSFKIGLISLIPNMVPAIIAYGIWSFLRGEISMAASVVICMCIGIVVDDTVHFMSKYLKAKREMKLNTVEAIEYSFKTVGVALVVTSLVLTAGFMVLAMSSFAPSWESGALVALTIAVALVADFVLIPLVLFYWDGGKESGKEKGIDN